MIYSVVPQGSSQTHRCLKATAEHTHAGLNVFSAYYALMAAIMDSSAAGCCIGQLAELAHALSGPSGPSLGAKHC